MNRSASVLVLVLATVTADAGAGGSIAAAQNGLRITSEAVQLDIGGRVQTQLNTTSVEGEAAAQLFLRRARIELDIVANDFVSGRLQADFGGERLSVKDAYMQLNFSPGFRMLAGKAFRPFSLLRLTSSTRILPIERGVSIRGVDGYDAFAIISDLGYADRDVGVQVLGQPAGGPVGFSYQAGVFAGPPLPGRSADTSPFQLGGRVRIQPAADVQVGGAWSNRAFSPAPVAGTMRGNAFEVDVEIGGFDRGLHFLGELIAGDFDPFRAADFFGAQGWLGFRTQPIGRISTLEPLIRLSYADVDLTALATGGTLVTPGVNIFFGGWNRLMINYDIWSPVEGGTEGSFKTQLQLVF